ncbi:UDP-glucose 4-epimerase [Paucilactobacillus hokkaidonensis JCM 18461]|uniref:UDP-glucose 4-epimerase n=2 Tax=Paucilactobacillus hokkaidonensis TaxID=1193095 RepID=A0A0A1GWB4_9LACO|nr:NAD-dependent epimerase/dehydratase family protein [Paucilactobacillus hokkaidonensis]BAP86300.1 UDP-glucose 4-epimerase [Paucilactobacillus hokkaidonensis JCM 18461]
MNIVLIGGNGYLGRAATQKLLERSNEVTIYVLSRSGNNKLVNQQIINIPIDVGDYHAVKPILPEKIDYVIDFVGCPANDVQELNSINKLPAQTMLKIATDHQVKAMGFIGGILGPKSFTTIKSEIIQMLQKSSIPLVTVEPTLIYGNGRKDSMTKMVPLLKFLGLFSKKFKPVDVNLVADELINKLIKY